MCERQEGNTACPPSIRTLFTILPELLNSFRRYDLLSLKCRCKLPFQAKYNLLASSPLNYPCLSSPALAELIENWQHLKSWFQEWLRKPVNVSRPLEHHLFLPRGVFQALSTKCRIPKYLPPGPQVRDFTHFVLDVSGGDLHPSVIMRGFLCMRPLGAHLNDRWH